MRLTLDIVREALGATEPEYLRLRRDWGPGAVPFLQELAASGDMRLGTKAVYLAALIDDPQSGAIVQTAAEQPHERMRVAAAAAASDLDRVVAAAILSKLLIDRDAGVRKVALTSAVANPSIDLLLPLVRSGVTAPGETIRWLSSGVRARFEAHNRAVSISRIFIAFLILYDGIDKLLVSRFWVTVFSQIGFGQWLRYAIGAIEITGAILLMVPRATIAGVVLLACTMGGVLLVNVLIVGIGVQTAVIAFLLGALLLIGAAGRAR